MMRIKKTLVFPKEHGSWALTFEPLTLALLIVPSWNGVLLFLGSTLAFFSHASAKVLLESKFKNKEAWFVFFLLGVPAAILLAWFVRLTDYSIYLPLIAALALMVLYLFLEALSLGRALATELMASVAMGLIALSMVLAGGMNRLNGLGFLAVLYSRSLMTTLYIHYRVLRLKKHPHYISVNHVLHIADFLLISFLWYRHLIPFLAFVAVMILTVRSFWGVSSWAAKATVRKLGFQEVYFGLAFMILVVAGYWLGF